MRQGGAVVHQSIREEFDVAMQQGGAVVHQSMREEFDDVHQSIREEFDDASEEDKEEEVEESKLGRRTEHGPACTNYVPIAVPALH